MAVSWGGGRLMSDEEIDALWKDQEAPQTDDGASAFWMVMFLLLSGLDVLAVFYAAYRVISWLSGLIWKVL